MNLARIFQQLTFSVVCLTGLVWAAPSHAANAVRPPASMRTAEPAVTLAHWEYRHHRRYWVQDHHRYWREGHR